MAMSTTDINDLIGAAIPEARIDVQGEGGKYQVRVVAVAFAGLNRVKRQQLVYRVLNEHIQSGAIHAVSMLLQTPEEAGDTARAEG